jgi:hypothetical protein
MVVASHFGHEEDGYQYCWANKIIHGYGVSPLYNIFYLLYRPPI